MPLQDLVYYLLNADLELIPLGEFVQLTSKFKLNNIFAFREFMYKLIPVIRKNQDEPLVYENFKEIFDSSLRDDINFELIYYFQFAES